jgi:chromosome segregation ATPase
MNVPTPHTPIVHSQHHPPTKMNHPLNLNAAPFIPSWMNHNTMPFVSCERIKTLEEENAELKAALESINIENERLQMANKSLKKHYSEHVSELMKEDEKNERLEETIQKQLSTICDLKTGLENLQKEKEEAVANMDVMRNQVEEKTRGLSEIVAVLHRITMNYRCESSHWLQEKAALQSTLNSLCTFYQSKNE